MGKKIKKFISKTNKVIGKIDPLMGGDVVLGAMGLPNVLDPETGMANKAQREADAAAKEESRQDAFNAQEREQYANAMQAQRDSATDLSLENVADIRTGDAAKSTAQDSNLRKRKKGSVSSQLGINV